MIARKFSRKTHIIYYGAVYAPRVIFVTGHTPTFLIDGGECGRIFKGAGHIALDCSSFDADGRNSGSLGCICLDTLEEYYF